MRALISQVVAELPQFIRDARTVGLTESEHDAIVDSVSRTPMQGDEIRGSGGVRKANFSQAEVAGFKALTMQIVRYWRRRTT